MANMGATCSPQCCAQRVSQGCWEAPGMRGRGLEVSQGPRAFPVLLGDSECQFSAWLRVSHVIWRRRK